MKRTLRAQADYRTSMLRNQLTSLVLFESVTTTKAKANQLVPFANHFFNLVKSADLNAKRKANQTLFDQNAARKVFEEIMPRYSSSDTTFVRLFRVMPRAGDSASMAMVNLIKPLQVKPAKPAKTDETAKKPVAKKAKATK